MTQEHLPTQQPIATTLGLLPITCPKCGVPTTAAVMEGENFLRTLCCLEEIPGTRPPAEEE